MHLNTFSLLSYIKMQQKYPTYLMSKVILKLQTGHIFHRCTIYNIYLYIFTYILIGHYLPKSSDS